MCVHDQYKPKPKLPLNGEEVEEEEQEVEEEEEEELEDLGDEIEAILPALSNSQIEQNPHPLVTPNFRNPCSRIFPPNFFNLVMGLSEGYSVPKEYVYMVMCGQPDDFITMAENIIETPPGQPVEYSMPEPLKGAWKYLMDTGDPGMDGDAEEEVHKPIPMEYVNELLSPVRNQLVMRDTLWDYLRTLEDEVSTVEMENSDKENNPQPTLQ